MRVPTIIPFSAVAIALLLAVPADAQNPPNPGPRSAPYCTYNASGVTLAAGAVTNLQCDANGNLKVTGGGGGTVTQGTPGSTPWPVTDTNSGAFIGEVAMTVGTTYAVGRSLKVIATAAGNVAVTYSDGSTGIWPVVVGTQTFPLAVAAINSSGTTATATYFELR